MFDFYEGCRLCVLHGRRLCPERCFECSEPQITKQDWIHSLGVYYSRVQVEHWTSRWSRAIIRAKRGDWPVISSFSNIFAWYISRYLSELGPCLVVSVPGFLIRSETCTSGLIVQTREKMIQQRRCGTDNQRKKNVAGIYSVLEPSRVKDRNVILLDDIVTSGATLTECARILYEAGADVVVGLTLTRTVRNGFC